jgi:hypothetical protein
MKTSDMKDLILDWAVATANGDTFTLAHQDWAWYSSDWLVGGPIIEQEGVELRYWGFHSVPWRASIDGGTDAGIALYEGYGTTPLIAAMRCFVASKLGDDIDVPKELT